MKIIRAQGICLMTMLAALAVACSKPKTTAPSATAAADTTAAAPAYFHVDPASAGSISGVVRYGGPRPVAKLIDMSEDPACVAAHKGKAQDESLLVAKDGSVANAFVYVEKGLEGKVFETPKEQVTIDQSGCWFHPRVLGLQTNQVLAIVNSDPVTHNIHPMAMINREWNHSQGPGDAPVLRHFAKAEVMIPVKCNIHSWMHAYIGVVDNPYFAVTKVDGRFTLPNLPPGTYTVAVWHEGLPTEEQTVTVSPAVKSDVRFMEHAK